MKSSQKSIFKRILGKLLYTETKQIMPFLQVPFLVFIILFCGYIFIQWNKIPNRSFEFLFTELSHKNQSNDSTKRVAEIKITYPSTFSKEDGRIEYLIHNSYETKSDTLNLCQNFEDSYPQVFTQYSTFPVDEKFKQFVYGCGVRYNTNENMMLARFSNREEVKKQIEDNGETKSISLCSALKDTSGYVLYTVDFYSYKPERSNSFGSNVFRRRKWYYFSDLSQSYYSVKLEPTNFDSLLLTFDFSGQTDFSEMIPSPDETSYSCIKFTSQEKIQQITQNGLKFYVRHSELVNLQTIRSLALTTIISICATSMLGIIFVGIFFRRKS